jgi:hypothetical protein
MDERITRGARRSPRLPPDLAATSALMAWGVESRACCHAAGNRSIAATTRFTSSPISRAMNQPEWKTSVSPAWLSQNWVSGR